MTPSGSAWKTPREGLNALQRVAGVAPFALYQGLVQAAAIHICLTAVSVRNVLCMGKGTTLPL